MEVIMIYNGKRTRKISIRFKLMLPVTAIDRKSVV